MQCKTLITCGGTAKDDESPSLLPASTIRQSPRRSRNVFQSPKVPELNLTSHCHLENKTFQLTKRPLTTRAPIQRLSTTGPVIAKTDLLDKSETIKFAINKFVHPAYQLPTSLPPEISEKWSKIDPDYKDVQEYIS